MTTRPFTAEHHHTSPRTWITLEVALYCLTLFVFIYPDLLFDRLINTQLLFGIPGDSVLTGIKLLLMGSVLLTSLPYWWQIVEALWTEKLILLLLALALASSLWSSTPLATLRHGVVILATTLIGCAFAIRFERKQQLILLALTFAIMILLSLVAIAVVPEKALEHGSYYLGSWAGIQGDKNGLGIQMVFSTFVFLLLALTAGSTRWKTGMWAGTAVSIVMLLMSYSRTAMAAGAVAGSGLVLLMRPWKLQQEVLWLAAGTAAVIVLLSVSVFVKPATWLMQADATSTVATEPGDLGTLVGRTLIWEQIMPIIRQRLLLGYGYNSFWTGADGSLSSTIRLPGNMPVGSAHNGYLEFLLDIGLIGLVMFLMSLALTLARAVRTALRSETMVNLWPAVYVTALIVLNIAASTFMENVLAWIIYVSVVMSLVRQSALVSVSRAEATSVPPSDVP